MTSAREYQPRLPEHGPTGIDLVERDRFQQLVSDSLPSVRASAETWRNGLAAFITLVTAAVVIKGRAVMSDVPTGWRVAITTLIALGLALAVVGLWQALAAQAGVRPEALTVQDIHARFGSVQAYQVAAALKAGRRLELARYIVAGALASLLVGIVLTWWAPAAPTSPPSYVKVSYGTNTTCGTLASADGGRLQVTVMGRDEPAIINLIDVSNLALVTSCG